MSELTDIAGSPGEFAPGITLSAPRLKELAVVESVFSRWHVARTRRMVRGWPMELQQQMISAAFAEVKSGELTVGMPAYQAMQRSARGTALFFWLMARIRRPELTQREARELFERDETRATRMVFEQLGLLPPEGLNEFAADLKKNTGVTAQIPDPTPTSPAAPSDGGSSTIACESAD